MPKDPYYKTKPDGSPAGAAPATAAPTSVATAATQSAVLPYNAEKAGTDIQEQEIDAAVSDFIKGQEFAGNTFENKAKRENLGTSKDLAMEDFTQRDAQIAYQNEIGKASQERITNLAKTDKTFYEIIRRNMDRARNAGVYTNYSTGDRGAGGIVRKFQDDAVGALNSDRASAEAGFAGAAELAGQKRDSVVQKSNMIKSYLEQLNAINIDSLNDDQKKTYYDLTSNLRDKLIGIQKELESKKEDEDKPGFFMTTQPNGEPLATENASVKDFVNNFTGVLNQGLKSLGFQIPEMDIPTQTEWNTNNGRIAMFQEYARELKEQGVDANTARGIFMSALRGSGIKPEDSMIANQIFLDTYNEYTGKVSVEKEPELRKALKEIAEGKNPRDVYDSFSKEFPDQKQKVAEVILEGGIASAASQILQAGEDLEMQKVIAERVFSTVRELSPSKLVDYKNNLLSQLPNVQEGTELYKYIAGL